MQKGGIDPNIPMIIGTINCGYPSTSRVEFADCEMANETEFCLKAPSTLRTDCCRWWVKPWLLSFFSMFSFSFLFFLVQFVRLFGCEDCCSVSDTGSPSASGFPDADVTFLSVLFQNVLESLHLTSSFLISFFELGLNDFLWQIPTTSMLMDDSGLNDLHPGNFIY